MRFRRALDRGNITEALSAASELQFVDLAEALELTLLLADEEPDKFGGRCGSLDRPVPAESAERRCPCEPGGGPATRGDPGEPPRR
jgi:hypothetical protein